MFRKLLYSYIFSIFPSKLPLMRIIFFLLILATAISCKTKQEDNRLAKASKENKNGWIYVHLEGSPTVIGYQHGYLLANEIDTTIQAVSYLLQHETKKDWAFYRACAKNLL